mgnify:CR=1 FL=1
MADIKFDFSSEGNSIPITFPTGSDTVLISQAEDMSYFATTSFTSSLSGAYSNASINGVNLTSSFQSVHSTGLVVQTTYEFSAKLENGTVTLRQHVRWESRSKPDKLRVTLTGQTYSTTMTVGSGIDTINYVHNGTTTSLMVLKYATTGANLGEATRSGISEYSKAALDGYVGLKNDTWSGITNASSLVAGNYYYIRVKVSDTNKTGKFCVKFISANGTTITTDNMGWGYDGEPIYTQNVWVKPYVYTQTVGSNTTIVAKKTSSPYRGIGVGDTILNKDTIYYGDMFNITATPASGYTLTKFTINGSSQVSSSTTAVTKSWRCTGPITVITEAVVTPSGSLLAPIITDAHFVADDAVTVTFKNPNSVAVTTHGSFTDVEGDTWGTGSTSTSANDMAASLTISLNSSGQYQPGWTVTLYFTAAGYPDSATTTYTGT